MKKSVINIYLKQLVAATKLAPVLNHLREREKIIKNETSATPDLTARSQQQTNKQKTNKKLQQSKNNKTLVQKLGR